MTSYLSPAFSTQASCGPLGSTGNPSLATTVRLCRSTHTASGIDIPEWTSRSRTERPCSHVNLEGWMPISNGDRRRVRAPSPVGGQPPRPALCLHNLAIFRGDRMTAVELSPAVDQNACAWERVVRVKPRVFPVASRVAKMDVLIPFVCPIGHEDCGVARRLVSCVDRIGLAIVAKDHKGTRHAVPELRARV
eukprot:1235402-Prymnesium_polylepis.1